MMMMMMTNNDDNDKLSSKRYHLSMKYLLQTIYPPKISAIICKKKLPAILNERVGRQICVDVYVYV